MRNFPGVQIPQAFQPAIIPKDVPGLGLRNLALQIFSSNIFRPSGKKTFCNLFVSLFFHRLGYSKFNGLLASEIVKRATSSADFIEVEISEAITASRSGRVLFAGVEGVPHGHVCILLNSLPSFSPSFDRFVPHCVNVGRSYKWDVPVSLAFKKMPHFFMLQDAAMPSGYLSRLILPGK